MNQLTIRDYANINTIKTYYNEIYDYILDDIIDNKKSYLFIQALDKYKDIINYSKFLYSPNLINKFKDYIKQARYAIIEYGTKHARKHWNHNLFANNILIFVKHNKMLKNNLISDSYKMNYVLNKMIYNNKNNDKIDYLLIKELNYYNLKTKIMYYHNNYPYYDNYI